MGEFIGNNIDVFYGFTALMLFVATSIIIVFAILGMIKNTNNAKKTIFTSGGLIVVLGLAYFGFASDEVIHSYEQYEITSNTSQLVGMGLWSFYILLLVAVASIAITGVLNKINSK